MKRRFLLGALLLSGFAGLAWELLWVRLLALALGGTTLSFSTVLAVFFGGLALGSRWAGKHSLTTTRPVRAYALLEALTGVLGLALYPLMKNLGTLVSAIDFEGGGPGSLGLRLLVAVVFLLPPTFLMGATLPFVSVATVARDEDTGRGTALIYGLNTFGACVGAWSISFVLLPTLGVFTSVLIVAAANAVAALIAFLYGRGADGEGRAAAAATTDTKTPTTKEGRVVIATAFVGGLVATGSQVIWTRTFSIALGGTTYALGSVLVSVLVGIALGSVIASALCRRFPSVARPALAALVMQLFGIALFSAGLPLTNYLLASIAQADWPGRVLHHADIAVVWASLVVPTVASGVVFPLLIALTEQHASNVGETLSRLYASNTFGCILGSTCIGFWGLPVLGSNGSSYALALLAAAAIALFAVVVCGKDRLFALTAVAAALLVIAVFPQFDVRTIRPRASTGLANFFLTRKQLDDQAQAATWFKEGDSATAVVRTDARGAGLSLNGLGQGGRSTEPPHVVYESLLVGAFPWVHSAQTNRGLVVGLGAGGTVRTLNGLGVKNLEVLELEASVREAVGEIWGGDSPLSNAGTHVIHDDARHHLLLSARRRPGSFDFITSMPAHPWVAPALFTREFFVIAKENLNEAGVFSTWFGTGGMPPSSIEALFGAFASAFPHCLVYYVPDAGAYYALGSKSPVRFDPRRFEQMAASEPFRGVRPEAVTARAFASMVVAYGSAQVPKDFPVSTDDNGIIEFSVMERVKDPPDPLRIFSMRSLPSNAIVDEKASERWVEFAEHALGTPFGRLPQPERTVKSLRFLETAASDERLDYVKARIALIEGDKNKAKTFAQKVTTPVLVERLAVFSAASGVDARSPPPLREEATRSLEPFRHRGDVRAFLLSLGATDSGPILPAPLTTDADAIDWLFASPESPSRLPPERTAIEGGKLLRRAAVWPSTPVATTTLRFIENAKWTELKALAEQMRRRAGSFEQSAAIRAALQAGSEGAFPKAVELLLEAAERGPLDLERTKLLLRSSLKTKNDKGLVLASRLLQARGYHGDHIQELIELYRKQAEESEKAETPTAKPSP